MTTRDDRCPLVVVMPVYDEEAIVADVVRDVAKHVLDEVPGSRLVVVDDHSRDATPALLEELATADPRITVLRNEVNRGHGPSVRRGLDAADATWILHVDSDGQLDLGEFGRLWAATPTSDLVVGVRVDRDDPRVRLVLTRAVRLLVSGLARAKVRDANSPFKLVSRELFDHLAPAMPRDAFAPSIMLVLGARRCGARVTEVPVTHFARPHGRSSIHVRRLASVVARCTTETVRFARRRPSPFRRSTP